METLLLYRETIIAAAAATSVFFAFVLVSWPYLAPDRLDARMKDVASERKRIRSRERGRSNQQAQPALLMSEPRKVYKELVQRFNLGQQTEDKEVVKRLRMAGYRGQRPVVKFVLVRLIAPLIMFVLAAAYVFLVLQLNQPLFIQLAIALAAAMLGYYAPDLYVKNQITKRQQAIQAAWPDALDLLLICVESGMGIESAFRKVSTEIGSQSVELAEELSLTTAELAYLQNRRVAYENLAARTGLEGVQSVVTSLIQAEKYGTPIAQSLRVLAQENRDMRMSAAEKKAASLPPKLTVPMILFFLPVLFAVIITPAAIQIMELK